MYMRHGSDGWQWQCKADGTKRSREGRGRGWLGRFEQGRFEQGRRMGRSPMPVGYMEMPADRCRAHCRHGYLQEVAVLRLRSRVRRHGQHGCGGLVAGPAKVAAAQGEVELASLVAHHALVAWCDRVEEVVFRDALGRGLSRLVSRRRRRRQGAQALAGVAAAGGEDGAGQHSDTTRNEMQDSDTKRVARLARLGPRRVWRARGNAREASRGMSNSEGRSG